MLQRKDDINALQKSKSCFMESAFAKDDFFKKVFRRVRQLFYKGENKDKKKAIVLDTSIIGVPYVIKMLNKIENSIFVFSAVVIEELEQMAKCGGSKGSNARALLHFAMNDNSKICLAPNETSLNGWLIDNNDSLIIKTAIELSKKFDVTVFTCDKVFALKAKSFGINYEFFKQKNSSPKKAKTKIKKDVVAEEPNISNKIKIDYETVFVKIDDVKKVETIRFTKQSIFFYISNYGEFPYYFKLNEGHIVLLNKQKIFLTPNDYIYKVQKDKIEEYSIRDFSEKNNVVFEKIGVLSEEIADIESVDIKEYIMALHKAA